MEFEDIERILELVRQHDLAEFEFEQDGLKLRVRKAGAAFQVLPPQLQQTPVSMSRLLLHAPVAPAPVASAPRSRR